MLSYAFDVLEKSDDAELASEEFQNIHDLFAAILGQGMAQQMKRGLYKEYIEKQENDVLLRGKLNITDTINNRIRNKQQLACEYVEFSVNIIFNQVLKTTATILLQQQTVCDHRRRSLKKILLFFSEVDFIEPGQIRWNQLVYHRNNRTYQLLMNICYLVIKDLLQTEENGQYKLANFLSEQSMHSLFERFVLEYYRFHHSGYRPVAPQIKWVIDDEVFEYLPIMQTDIVLNKNGKFLVIDTKYYQRSMQSYYQNTTLHSANLYQIFTYVKNMDATHDGRISGMLLYAKTNEEITPDYTYRMSGNRIYVRTLDLNLPFPLIRNQLDNYLLEWEQDS